MFLFFFFPADCFVFGLSSQGARWQCLQVARPLEQSRCPPYHTSDMSESHSIVSAPLKHVPGARTKWQCCSLCCTKHSLVCPCCYWVCQHHPWAHLILWSVRDCHHIAWLGLLQSKGQRGFKFFSFWPHSTVGI